MNSYPNPWDFANTNTEMHSFDNKFKIEFGELNEIAMGAPLGGKCYLITDNIKILLNNFSAGPVIWENNSYRIAIPIWKKTAFKGTVQQIMIVDLYKSAVTLYKQTFNVLDLRSFNGDFIFGYDSPIHKKKILNLDITKLNIDKTVAINQAFD